MRDYSLSPIFIFLTNDKIAFTSLNTKRSFSAQEETRLLNRSCVVNVPDLATIFSPIERPRYFTNKSATSLFQLGFPVPTEKPAVQTGSPGNLTGDYMWRIVFVDKHGAYSVLSNQSPPSDKVTLNNAYAVIVYYHKDIPKWATHIRVYRTFANQTEPFFEVKEETINWNDPLGYTLIVDDVPDLQLGSMAKDDYYPFPCCAYATYFQGRLIATGNREEPNLVYLSNALTPWGWNSAKNWWEIGDQEPITGIASLGNLLFIFKKKNIWRISSLEEGLDNVWIEDLAIGTGTVTHHSIIKVAGMLFFISDSPLGIYAFNGKEIVNISKRENVDITPFLRELENLDLENCVGVYNSNENSLVWVFPNSQKQLIFNLDKKIWTCYGGNIDTIGEVRIHKECFLWGGTSNGYIIELENKDGTQYDGSGTLAYMSFYTDFELPSTRKRLQFIDIHLEKPPVYPVDVTIAVEKDGKLFGKKVVTKRVSEKTTRFFINRAGKSFKIIISWTETDAQKKLVFSKIAFQVSSVGNREGR